MSLKQFIFILILIGLYIIGIFVNKGVVRDHLTKKYRDYELKSLKWAILGPIAPGRGNYKYCATLKHKTNDEWKSLYAITSLFGSVYIHD